MTADEFLSFMQTRGVAYKARMVRGGGSVPLSTLAGFLSGTFNTVLDWAGQVYSQVPHSLIQYNTGQWCYSILHQSLRMNALYAKKNQNIRKSDITSVKLEKCCRSGINFYSEIRHVDPNLICYGVGFSYLH